MFKECISMGRCVSRGRPGDQLKDEKYADFWSLKGT